MPIESRREDVEREAWAYCERMLPLVSRTFSLNIRQLTGTLYRSVLVGYLLFRMADTVEDAPGLSEAEKIKGLIGFSRFFENGGLSSNWYTPLVRPFLNAVCPETPEGDLLRHGDRVFICYAALPQSYREIMGEALRESMLGMVCYQERKRENPGGIFQLKDWNDLTQYCYYVAGVVGKMLTRLFCLESELMPYQITLSRNEIHFGLALQLTNIAKDYPADIKRGWCYLPQTLTARLGITPQEILDDPGCRHEEITQALIKATLPHFEGTYRYIAGIPLHLESIRKFCIIPFVLAYHTLAFLCESRISKLSRNRVRHLLGEVEGFCRSNARLKADYDHIFESLR